MFIVGNLFQAVAEILDKLLWLYYWVIIVAVFISWVSADPSNPVVNVLRAMTQPLFEWVRRRLPFAVVGMIDLSPLIVLMAIWFLRRFLIASLLDLAFRLR